MAQQGRATKHLGRLNAHAPTLATFAREIKAPKRTLLI